MSHIRRTSNIDISEASTELLQEGLSIVCDMLELEGENVDWECSSKVLTAIKNGKTLRASVKNGELEFEAPKSAKRSLKKFQQQVENLIEGAVYLAGRAALAHSKGKNVDIVCNPETSEMTLTVKEAP